MSKSDLSKNYSLPPQPGNPRATEAWALTQAALRMKAAQATANAAEMQAAVRLNWRLWTILQSDLLDPESPVPAEIRVNMLTLAAFVDRQSVDFLGDPQPHKLDGLISINRELAGGLFSTPEAAANAERGDPPAQPASAVTSMRIST